MGCDIHVVAETRSGWNVDSRWRGHIILPNLGRNYTLFALMAGVRGYYEESFDVRGFPEDASKESIEIYKPHDENTLDFFHSASHMTLDEFDYCLKTAENKIYAEVFEYSRENLDEEPPPKEEYFSFAKSLLNYLRQVEKNGDKIRLVFWFDS